MITDPLSSSRDFPFDLSGLRGDWSELEGS